jgi:hypothetical protein
MGAMNHIIDRIRQLVPVGFVLLGWLSFVVAIFVQEPLWFKAIMASAARLSP